jgi:hypothetical protein
MISTEARDPAGPEGRVTENAHPPNTSGVPITLIGHLILMEGLQL